jgi:ribosomal protein L3 glutamine methyltransferase
MRPQDTGPAPVSLGDAIVAVAAMLSDAPLCYGHGTDNPDDEAVYLVGALLGLDFSALDDARPISSAEWGRIEAALSQRVHERLPVAYITGRAWFAQLEWHCDPRVIIPRSPLAELIENSFSPWLAPGQVRRVLDLCCGSGCIGLATAVHLPACAVDLVDIDAGALAVARQNQARYALADRTRVLAGDLFAPLGEHRYDLILSNPPYVDAEDMAALPPEYHHEPVLALAAGDDGLLLARRIIDGSRRHLTDDGVLVLEVGNSAAALEAAFPALPFLWLEFERGGHGVCLLHARDLPR